MLLQSATIFLSQSETVCYYKVRQFFLLLQSATVCFYKVRWYAFTKCDSIAVFYYIVRPFLFTTWSDGMLSQSATIFLLQSAKSVCSTTWDNCHVQ